MNYEKDIKIDETALDIEWLEQPALFMKYARHYADTMQDLDEAKEKVELVKAELDSDIRLNPEDYVLGKITDAAIANKILCQASFKKANKEWLTAKHENQVAKGAVDSFNQRKEALENLVKLHGQSYFAGPKVPRDIAWEKKEKEKKVDTGIGSRLQRTRK